MKGTKYWYVCLDILIFDIESFTTSFIYNMKRISIHFTLQQKINLLLLLSGSLLAQRNRYAQCTCTLNGDVIIRIKVHHFFFLKDIGMNDTFFERKPMTILSILEVLLIWLYFCRSAYALCKQENIIKALSIEHTLMKKDICLQVIFDSI